jgi:predicted restriction endonuclease
MRKDSKGSLARNSGAARSVCEAAYPYKCCVVCGLPGALDVAHLDQRSGNNSAENLAWLCKTHHWMVDAGLYPIDVVKVLRAHWQNTKGIENHAARMKDAGRKAAETRKRRRAAELSKYRRAARKAVITRRANAAAKRAPH